jgi:hypothetical protein
MTAEADFSLDSSKPSGRRSYCKACDRRRGRAYYDAHKDELYAQRAAAREAAWQAELEAHVEEHRKRVAAAKKLHAAQSRRQKEFLRSIGVPDLSPEEVTEKARRRKGSDQPHEWDRSETVPVDEERERPPDPGGPSGEGAPPGDPDYHLHAELGEETKRLATHPREEAHRLVEELREGETETTPLIALSGLVLWLGVLVAIVIALVFLIARLAS